MLHRPQVGEGGHVHYLELDQFIGPNYLITTHGPRNLAVPLEMLLGETDELADKMLRGRYVPTGPWAASRRLVGGLAIAEERFVNKLAREVGELEKQVMAHAGDSDPQRFLEVLFTTRHALLTVRTMTSQSAEIYGRALRLLSDQDKLIQKGLRDNKDAYDRLSRITHSQLDFLTGITEYYRARTDTKMTIAAERLAVIAAITLPVTAISSVMGMNVIVNDATQWPAADRPARADDRAVAGPAALGEAPGLVVTSAPGGGVGLRRGLPSPWPRPWRPLRGRLRGR